MKILENYKKRHEFSAENCRKKQQRSENTVFERKIDDIKGRINYVVENSDEENSVIYRVQNNDFDFYERIAEYFSERGFNAVITEIPSITGEYLIISW